MAKLKDLPKYKKRLVKEAIKGFDFDWVYLLRLERIKLQNMLLHHQTEQFVTDWKYICKNIQICINLLDIIIDDELKYKGYVNFNNEYRYIRNGFIFHKDPFGKSLLRVEKAFMIYHKMRIQYLREWWD